MVKNFKSPVRPGPGPAKPARLTGLWPSKKYYVLSEPFSLRLFSFLIGFVKINDFLDPSGGDSVLFVLFLFFFFSIILRK